MIFVFYIRFVVLNHQHLHLKKSKLFELMVVLIFHLDNIPWQLMLFLVDQCMIRQSACFLQCRVIVKREVVVFASMATSWNSLFQALISPIFSHLFKIIVCLLLNFFHVLCNHSQICGFKLLILKSTLKFLPFSIYYLMTPNVELHLECMLEWYCEMTLVGWRMMAQFAGTKTTKIFGCFSFIQSKNSWCLCTLQQSNNQTSLWCVWNPNNSIWA